MKNLRHYLTPICLTIIIAGTTYAMDSMEKTPEGMEKCAIVKMDRGMIKPGQNDGDYTNDDGKVVHKGESWLWDKQAWVWVPTGECKKINDNDDISGLPEDIKAKIITSRFEGLKLEAMYKFKTKP